MIKPISMAEQWEVLVSQKHANSLMAHEPFTSMAKHNFYAGAAGMFDSIMKLLKASNDEEGLDAEQLSSGLEFLRDELRDYAGLGEAAEAH